MKTLHDILKSIQEEKEAAGEEAISIVGKSLRLMAEKLLELEARLEKHEPTPSDTVEHHNV